MRGVPLEQAMPEILREDIKRNEEVAQAKLRFEQEQAEFSARIANAARQVMPQVDWQSVKEAALQVEPPKRRFYQKPLDHETTIDSHLSDIEDRVGTSVTFYGMLGSLPVTIGTELKHSRFNQYTYVSITGSDVPDQLLIASGSDFYVNGLRNKVAMNEETFKENTSTMSRLIEALWDRQSIFYVPSTPFIVENPSAETRYIDRLDLAINQTVLPYREPSAYTPRFGVEM